MPDPIDDLESRYGGGPLTFQIRQDVKRGGELMATYEMEFPSLRAEMLALAGDLREGRVERVKIAGRPVSAQDLHALAIQTDGSI